MAITAASGFVAPWAAIVIGIGSGFIAVFGVIWVEKIGIDDPIGAVAVHGMSGVWGTLACGLFAVPLSGEEPRHRVRGGLVYTGLSSSSSESRASASFASACSPSPPRTEPSGS